MFLTAIFKCRLTSDCKYLLSEVLKNVSNKAENFYLGTLSWHSAKMLFLCLCMALSGNQRKSSSTAETTGNTVKPSYFR